MKKIAIYCVNYNSYEALYNYYNSIVIAAQNTLDYGHIDVFIADNTEKNIESVSLPQFSNVKTKVFAFHKNLGYFGAIHKMMEQTEYTAYDYVIVSNVDVKVDNFSFRELCQTQTAKQVGWIAPQILSVTKNRNLNPALIQRYSGMKLKLIKLQFKYPILHRIYEKTLYKHKYINPPKEKKEIYAGHGSFIILTKNYFKKCGIVNYPIFLYDEELYLAEECRLNYLTVLYEPSIKIYDIGKVSTGKMSNKFYCQCNLEGLTYILRKYYAD